MTAVRRWLQVLRPADVFALPVVVGVLAEFVLVQFASPYNTVPNIPLTMALQALAVGVAFAVLGTAYLCLRCMRDSGALRTVLLTSIPVAALIGGLVLVWARLATGLDNVPLWFLRTSSTVMHLTAMTILLWLAVSGVRTHYARLEALAGERDRLQALRAQAARELAALDDTATEAVRASILKALERSTSREAYAVRAGWHAAIDDVVRPLSRQLEAQTEDWIPPVPQLMRPQRIDWKAATLDGMTPALFSPTGVIVILNLIAAPMNLGRSGLVFALQFIAVSALVAWPMFWLIRRITLRAAGDTQGARRIAAFLAMCVLSGLALGLATLPFTLNGPQPLRYVYLTPTFATVVAFAWGLAAAAQQQARATEAVMQQAAADLQWHIARSRELHRQRRRALAHALHGRVQAALAAGILELDRGIRDGTVNDQAIAAIQQRLTTVVCELDLSHAQPSPISVVVDKVQATWVGVLTMSLHTDPGLERALTSDSQTLMTLNDLIPELAFNSIKHSGARNLDITLEWVDHRTMRITAVSDATAGGALTQGEPGLGSRLLNTCAIEWSRATHGERTTTTVVLPVDAASRADGDAPFRGLPSNSDGLVTTPA